MASLQASNAVWLTQLTVAAAGISATYTAVGKFSGPLVDGYVISTLDQPVQLSFDGTNDHLAVPAGSTVPVFMSLNFKGNLTVMPTPFVAVKEIGNPTTGSLYICGYSAQQP